MTGTEASVQTITLDDLKAFYAAHFTPKAARMSFVGGLTRPEVERALAPLTEKWEATAVSIPLSEGNAARPAACACSTDILTGPIQGFHKAT